MHPHLNVLGWPGLRLLGIGSIDIKEVVLLAEFRLQKQNITFRV
jgi:hypothetical protein